MEPEASQPPADMIPKARLDDALRQLEAAKKAAEKWQIKFESALEATEAIKAEHTAALEGLRSTHENERIFGTAGIDDPDVIEIVRRKYGQHAPEEGAEKPAFADWFKGYRDSKPALLRAFDKAPEPPPAAKPPPTGGAVKANPVPVPPTAQPAPASDALPASFKDMDNAGRRAHLESLGLIEPRS